MSRLLNYFRAVEWYDSKIPFMLSAYLFHVLLKGAWTVPDIYACFLLYFLYLASFLAFSYLINDFSDMETDRKAGKIKVIFGVDRRITAAILAALPIIGTVPLWSYLGFRSDFLLLTALIYFLGAAYSIQLFRFKEKGFAGLLECAIAQRCVPLLLVPFLVDAKSVYFVLWILVSLLDGIRYLVIHQYMDKENDLKTGVRTFVNERRIDERRLLKRLFWAECAFFAAVFVRLSLISPLALLFLPAYIVYEKIISIVVSDYMNADWFCSFLAVPLEDLFNVFLLMILSLYLTAADFRLIGLLFMGILLTLRCFLGKSAFVKVYLLSKMKR